MTFQEALQKEKKWYRKVIIINLYHNKMLLRRKNWTMRDTAKRLKISHGAVSEARILALLVIDKPEFEKQTRKDALRYIRAEATR